MFFHQSDLFSRQILDPGLSSMLERSGDKKMSEMPSPKRSTLSSAMHASDLTKSFIKSNMVTHESDADVYQMQKSMKRSYPG